MASMILDTSESPIATEIFDAGFVTSVTWAVCRETLETTPMMLKSPSTNCPSATSSCLPRLMTSVPGSSPPS